MDTTEGNWMDGIDAHGEDFTLWRSAAYCKKKIPSFQILTGRKNKRKPVLELGGSFAVAIGEVTAGMAVEGEDAGEGLASVGFFGPGDDFGRALGDDATAALAAFRAEVDDPVGLFDDVEMVLDDEHGVAKIDQALKNIAAPTNVVDVQAGCRFDQTAG